MNLTSNRKKYTNRQLQISSVIIFGPLLSQYIFGAVQRTIHSNSRICVPFDAVHCRYYLKWMISLLNDSSPPQFAAVYSGAVYYPLFLAKPQPFTTVYVKFNLSVRTFERKFVSKFVRNPTNSTLTSLRSSGLPSIMFGYFPRK